MSDHPWLKYRAQAKAEEADLHQMITDDVRVAQQAAEITRLRAALATARREGKVEGIEWAAGMIRAFTKIAEKMADDMGLERSAEKAVQFAVGKVLEEAAAIRAALGEER